MTLKELLNSIYGWMVAHGNPLLLIGVAVPIIGTALARIGKGGKTDADGRLIANIAISTALAAVVFEALGLVLFRGVLDRSVFDMDARLFAAPLLCLGGCLLGIRWVFPLSELGSIRTFFDVGAFLAVGAAIVWMFSRFRGWGFYFIGSTTEALALGALAIGLIRRLYLRAFEPHKT